MKKSSNNNLCDHLLLLASDFREHHKKNINLLEKLPRILVLKKAFPESLDALDILLFALVFEDSFNDEPKTGWKLVDSNFSGSTGHKLDLINRLNRLTKERYLERLDLSLKSSNNLNRSTYNLRESTLAGLMLGKIEEPFFYKKVEDSGMFIELIRQMQIQINGDAFQWDDMIENVKILIQKNAHLNIIKGFNKLQGNRLKKMEPNQAEFELVFLVFLLEKFLDGDIELNLEENVELLETPFTFLDYLRNPISKGTHPLLKKGYLTEMQSNIVSRDKLYTFSDEGIEKLLGEEITLLQKTPGAKNMQLPEAIPACNLFFEGKLANQVDELKLILQQDGFEKWRKKIYQDSSREVGLTLLFFGKPGTGKTELALQLAKQSNRPIIKADMSEMRSMWYGESEKMVKRLFSRYNHLQKRSRKTPILFLNEADALIGKRIQTAVSIDQTNNAIQNILLDELENFSGILIATTNMKENFDPAFERRFLMKLEFQNPGPELRFNLLKQKFSNLPEKDLKDLAYQYPLSPAQFENIKRKLMVQDLLNISINTELLKHLFEEETSFQPTALGFQRN